MLKYVSIIVALYAGIMVIIIVFILALLVFADNASFNQTWVNETIPSLLDMLKIVVGAAVGSLSTAVAAMFGKK